MRVVILGAGGHGQVVADILWCMQRAGMDILPAAFLDDDPAQRGQNYLGVPVCGVTADLAAIAHEAVIVAIGNGRVRQRLFLEMQARGEQLAIAQHPTAVLAEGVQVGAGSMIAANVVVNTGSVIGQNVILNTACTVDHHNRIGDHAHIAPGAHLGGDVRVGEGTLIGIGAVVLPQRRVGDWATVGGGAVVVRDVGAGETAVGNPARSSKK
ncbi:MAG: acetyltransferase [Anaerolineales bacterium]|nr:acetyltransferase [Anaerolineales bacterium]